jgi:hypothetical protein
MASRAIKLFLSCERAVTRGVLIERSSRREKEFAVQHWIRDRLDEAGIGYVENGRNKYPDFLLEGEPSEGIEIKGLAFPGREVDFDANSAAPAGEHQGRTIYYVFVRYPDTEENRYAVSDLVICHGDVMNPTRGYIHKNRSFRTFGGYGDIMIRDRKMYVVRTPYDIAEGLTGQRTLIVPAGERVPKDLVRVGRFARDEADKVAVGYRFDLTTNKINVIDRANPTAGKRHTFAAYRIREAEAGPTVHLAARKPRRTRG